MRDAAVILVTGPDRDALIRIGRALVEERLIACLNVIGGCTSVYRWEAEVREEDEVLGILKTMTGRVDEVKRRLSELHAYDVPEILVLPVSDGSDAYLAWLRGEVD